MAYERCIRHFVYSSDPDGDDTLAFQRAFQAISVGECKHLVIEEKKHVIKDTAVAYGQGLSIRQDPGAIVFWKGTDQNKVAFDFQGSYRGNFKDLNVRSQPDIPAQGSPIEYPAKAAIRLTTKEGHPAGKNHFERLKVEAFEPGVWPGTAGQQFTHAVIIDDPGNFGNNDFNTFESPHLLEYKEAGMYIGGTAHSIEGSQAVGQKVSNPNIRGGKYGIFSRGAYHVSGGGVGSNSNADFRQANLNSLAGGISIRDVNSEGSAHFFVAYEPPDTTFQNSGINVTISGVRYALDKARMDFAAAFNGTGYRLLADGGALNEGEVGGHCPIFWNYGGILSLNGNRWGFDGSLYANPVNTPTPKLVRVHLHCDAVVISDCFATDNAALIPVKGGTALGNRAYVWQSSSHAWLPNRVFAP